MAFSVKPIFYKCLITAMCQIVCMDIPLCHHVMSATKDFTVRQFLICEEQTLSFNPFKSQGVPFKVVSLFPWGGSPSRGVLSLALPGIGGVDRRRPSLNPQAVGVTEVNRRQWHPHVHITPTVALEIRIQNVASSTPCVVGGYLSCYIPGVAGGYISCYRPCVVGGYILLFAMC